MAHTVHELRDLRVTRIALVRKGYRPINDGSVISIVKAEEDTMSTNAPAAAEASVLERISKALAGLLKSEPEAEADTPADAAAEATAEAAAEETEEASVEKADEAQVDQLEVDGTGNHADFTGTHSHGHVSHYAVVTHEHDHEHNADGMHYHSHVEKAAGEDGAHAHDLPDGWREVSADELRTLLGTTAVEKAADGNDAKVSKLLGDLEDLVKALRAAQDTDEAEEDAEEAVEKAAPTEERIAALVDERVQAALEPVAKALEDVGIARARQPVTANVTAQIRPDARPAAVDTDALKGLTFGDALRKLTRS